MIAREQDAEAVFVVPSHDPTAVPLLLSGTVRGGWGSAAPNALVRDAAAIAALLGLVLVFNPGLAFGGLVPAGYDTFVYFYPYRAYFGQAFAEGRLPLWNPHLFLGVPFLANPQAAVFYPGTWLFALIEVPKAYGINLLAHGFIAGASLYAFARWSLGTCRMAGLLGGAAFAFSGFLTGQAGHINQVSVAAWLPAAALALDAALRHTSRGTVAALIGVLVLQILAGHPQHVYMTLVVLGMLAVWRCWPSGVRGLGRGLALLLLAAGLAFGITAIQLVPTAELARQSIRGSGLDYDQARADALPWEHLLPALLPGFWSNLASSEFFGHLGAVALVLAWMGLLLAPGRAALFGAVLVTLGLTLAVGEATPLHRMFFDWLPGFASFRVPARWLLVYTFGAALLLTLGTDRLARGCQPPAPVSPRLAAGVPSWRLLVAGCGVPLLLLAAAVHGEPQPWRLLALWSGLAGGALLLALTALSMPRARVPATVLLAVAALVELWFAGAHLEHRQPVPDVAYRQPREVIDALRASDGLDGRFRFLSIASPEYEVKETAEYDERFPNLHPEARRNLLMSVKWNEALWPNVPLSYRLDSGDGYDGGVLPLSNFVKLMGALLGERVRSDGVLASRLDHLPPARWLDLLGVRYVLAARVKDLTEGGLYYDRAVTVSLQPGERVELHGLPDGAFTRLGLLSSFRGQASADGEVARLELGDADVTVVSLVAGVHTAAANAETPGAGGLLRVQEWGAELENDPADWLATISLDRRAIPRLAIVNTAVDAVFEVRALNLVDDVRQASFSVTPDPTVGRTEFFDMKLYDRRAALPRAYVVADARVLDDQPALAVIADPSFDPRSLVLLAPMEGARDLSAVVSDQVASAAIEHSDPERVRLRTRSEAGGYAVLSDSWYPGWRATVDGRDAPIVRANVLLRAVPISAGEHVIEFSYEPRSLHVGLLVSLASCGVGSLLWVLLPRVWRQDAPA